MIIFVEVIVFIEPNEINDITKVDIHIPAGNFKFKFSVECFEGQVYFLFVDNNCELFLKFSDHRSVSL